MRHIRDLSLLLHNVDIRNARIQWNIQAIGASTMQRQNHIQV